MQTTTAESRWSNGLSPFDMSWSKFMMWWFIVGDALLFAGFLASYGFSRLGSPDWPDPDVIFGKLLIATMTFVLISSSATMAAAVEAARVKDQPKLQKYLLLTLVGGVIFLGMQAYEWSQMISQGGLTSSNPWGDKLFGAYFFLITGFHGTHVLIGAVILLIAWLRAKKGHCNANGVEVAGLYWHFVDLVWVFIFGFFYLI